MLRVYVADEQIRERMVAKQASAHAGDCGVDLFVREMQRPDAPVVTQIKILTGAQVAAYDDEGRPTGCLLYPRSSIAKTNLALANSVGVIDAGYRGEVIAKMNVLPGVERCVNWDDKDLRLVQIVLPSMRAPRVEFVDSLDALGAPPDSRGAGGFGSTSKPRVTESVSTTEGTV